MTLRFWLGLIALWVLVTSSLAARARADGPEIIVEGCPEIDARDLQRLLDLELRTLGPDITAVSDLRLRCNGELVEVTAAPLSSAVPLKAQVTLRDAERGSITRLLALRISELLATPTPPPAPAPPAAPLPISAEAAPRPVEKAPLESRFALSLAASVRRMGRPRTLLSGVALGGDGRLSSHLTVRSDLGFEAGRVHVQVADVTWREVSAALALLWTVRSRHLELGAGPGFRGALSWLAAHDVASGHEGRRLFAPWAGPFLAGRIATHGPSAWQAQLDLEGGLVLVPIRGVLDGQQTLLSVAGPWLAAQLGASYRWPSTVR